jgi:hypothetical protein
MRIAIKICYIILSVATGCSCQLAHVKGHGLPGVALAISEQMNFDSHWFGAWAEGSNRTLRIVPSGPSSYLAAFEVYPGDFQPGTAVDRKSVV